MPLTPRQVEMSESPPTLHHSIACPRRLSAVNRRLQPPIVARFSSLLNTKAFPPLIVAPMCPREPREQSWRRAEFPANHVDGVSARTLGGSPLAYARLPHAGRALRASLNLRKASFGALTEARRARKGDKRVGTGSSRDASVSTERDAGDLPALAFSIRSRNRAGADQQGGVQRLLLGPSGGYGVDSGRDLPNSPRFAAAEMGRSYPERLQVVVSHDAGAVATAGRDERAVSGGEQAESKVKEALPPSLPELTLEEVAMLRAGERVQKQAREGGSGSGSVVVDVRADPETVMELLTNYGDYAKMIDTVRQCEVFPSDSRDPNVKKVRGRVDLIVCRGSLVACLLLSESRYPQH